MLPCQYILLCGTLAASAWHFPSWEYLPLIGPGSIRYQETKNSVQPNIFLPPLSPAATAKDTEIIVENYNPPTEVVSTSSIHKQNVIIDSLQQISNPASVTNVFVVTPQMLVEFFHRRENDAHDQGTSVITPFGFVPPTTATQPPSSATYESH